MDEATRQDVWLRAGYRCEYCHLPHANQLTPFEMDHVIARQHGGSDSLANLALSCLRCNLHKGTNLRGIDPKTRKLTRLFNPRRHSWQRHFRFQGALLLGRTAVGRTTVALFQVNEPARVALRQALIDMDLFD
jgi:hypothetical protein